MSTPRRTWHPSPDSALAAALDAPEQQPLSGSLAGGPTEGEVVRMWQRLREPPARVPWWRRRAYFAATFAVASLAVVLLVTLSGLRAPSNALRAPSGPLPSTLHADRAPTRVALSDGSSILLEATARLDVLGNDERTFVTTLRRGKATFDVKPGGPRRWVVEAGLVSVEVLGTRFSVRRDATAVTVSVEHGTVLVRGDIVGSERRLTAGQSLVARSDAASTEPVLAREPVVEAQAGAPSSSQSPAPSSAAPASSLEPQRQEEMHSSPKLAPAAVRAPLTTDSEERSNPNDNRTDSTPPASGARDTTSARSSDASNVTAVARDAVDRALEEADAERREGRLARAGSLYEKAVRLAPRGDARRGMAALSYARVAGNPERAATLLEASLDSMPPGLVEPALAHLADSYGRSGNRSKARVYAQRYLERFGTHPRARQVARWVDGP